MTHYRDELNQLCFSQADKQALTRRLLAQPAEAKRRRFPYRGLVAAVAAVSLLIGAAGAVSLAGVSPAFRTLFGITDDGQAQQLGATPVELAFSDQNGSGTTITVKEVVADQEQLYLRMIFTAPEGTVLPVPDENGQGPRYWLEDGGNGVVYCDFLTDEPDALNLFTGSYTLGVDYVSDADPTDNTAELIFHLSMPGGLPAQAAALSIENIGSLSALVGGQTVTLVDGLDLALTVPLRSDTPVYAFDGRCPVNLAGTTLAVVEDLTLSSISVSFDLILPADADTVPDWQVYLLLQDGSRVSAQPVTTSRTAFSVEGAPFFRAEHIRLSLEHPIDPGALRDIVFVGDNSRDYDGPAPTGEAVCFHFWPNYFSNSLYWSQISQEWKGR